MFGLGGRVSEESGFCIYVFFYYFEQAHFVMFSGLMGSLSIKLLYHTTYFFKIWTYFATKIFCGFAQPASWKIETLSNYIDVILVPFLVE